MTFILFILVHAKEIINFLRLSIKMVVGKLREGTNTLAVPHSSSVSLEICFNVEINKKSSRFTAMCFFYLVF